MKKTQYKELTEFAEAYLSLNRFISYHAVNKKNVIAGIRNIFRLYKKQVMINKQAQKIIRNLLDAFADTYYICDGTEHPDNSKLFSQAYRFIKR